MKHLKTTALKMLILILGLSALLSCSEDDEAPVVLEPSINYASTTINVQFYKEGSSAAPQVNWQGDRGTFSLVSEVNGLSIDPSTGVLSWTKDLPIGTRDIQVKAINNNGEARVSLTLKNPFRGVFTGEYEFAGVFFYLQYEFLSDNTMIARANDPDNPLVGEGTWTRNGNMIELEYDDQNGNPFNATGTLDLGTTAVYSGFWTYFDGSTGTFEVVLE